MRNNWLWLLAIAGVLWFMYQRQGQALGITTTPKTTVKTYEDIIKDTDIQEKSEDGGGGDEIKKATQVYATEFEVAMLTGAGTGVSTPAITQAQKDLASALAQSPALQALRLEAEKAGYTRSEYVTALANNKPALAEATAIQPIEARIQRETAQALTETIADTGMAVYASGGQYYAYPVGAPSGIAVVGIGGY